MTPWPQQGDTSHFQRDADDTINEVTSVAFQFRDTEMEIILPGSTASLIA